MTLKVRPRPAWTNSSSAQKIWSLMSTSNSVVHLTIASGEKNWTRLNTTHSIRLSAKATHGGSRFHKEAQSTAASEYKPVRCWMASWWLDSVRFQNQQESISFYSQTISTKTNRNPTAWSRTSTSSSTTSNRHSKSQLIGLPTSSTVRKYLWRDQSRWSRGLKNWRKTISQKLMENGCRLECISKQKSQMTPSQMRRPGSSPNRTVSLTTILGTSQC